MPKVPQRPLSYGEILNQQRPPSRMICLRGTRNYPSVEILPTRGKHGDVKTTKPAKEPTDA